VQITISQCGLFADIINCSTTNNYTEKSTFHQLILEKHEITEYLPKQKMIIVYNA